MGHRNETDTCLSATYDLSLTVSKFQSKIANFPALPVYLTTTMKGFPVELDIGARNTKKTRMMGLPGRERSLTISLAVWIQYSNVTRRTPDDRKDRGYS